MFPYKNQYPNTVKDECCNSGNTGDGVSEAQVVSLINNAITQDVTPDLLALLAKNEEQDARIDGLSLNKTAISPADITVHLDEIRSSGFYRKTGSSGITTEQGFPETETYRKGGFVLALFNWNGTYGIQQYYNFAGKRWQRVYYNADGWSEWQRLDASGEPADYEDLQNQVATNTANIAGIQETIQSMSGGDEYYYIPINSNEALMLKGANYIDTGFKLDGNVTLVVVGSLPDTTKQAVLAGAYKDNTQRTVLKILGKSHKIQSQWAGNVETTEDQVAEMDFSKRIEYIQTHANTRFYCSGKSVVLNNTGFTGTDSEIPLLLFNQAVTSTTVNNGALHSVNIDSSYSGGYDTLFIGARKYKKSDNSFVGYVFIQLWGGALFVRELPLPDGAYFELYEMQS